MHPNGPTIAPDWFQLSFDSLYPIIYAHRTMEAARTDAEFCIRTLDIAKKDTVLDLCCGNGRHMVHLAKAAGCVVGLDYSRFLLREARKILGPGARLVRADMRAQPFHQAFDVVVNFFTSFGYFMSEEENLAVIRGVGDSLKPGGRFFIDYLNRSWAEEHLEPNSVRYLDAYEIREDRWIDEVNRRINKTTLVLKDGEELSRVGESVKLYTDSEFKTLLAKGGLRVERVFGDYSGADCCDPSRPRMIVIGTKA